MTLPFVHHQMTSSEFLLYAKRSISYKSLTSYYLIMKILFPAALVFILDLVQAEDSIVGGISTTINEHPFQVSLQRYGSAICGGTIMSENKVLTSAHCTDGASASSISVIAGSSFRGRGGQLVNVTRVCQHPRYNP